MKRALLWILCLISFVVSATNQSSATAHKKLEQNNPLAGSRQQSSEQQFGAPVLTGKSGEKYHGNDPEQKNNPLAGSHQQSSEQQFGNPTVNGNISPSNSNIPPRTVNSPTVGGRQSSSDQIFGNPGDSNK